MKEYTEHVAQPPTPTVGIHPGARIHHGDGPADMLCVGCLVGNHSERGKVVTLCECWCHDEDGMEGIWPL
jgi:hypothetical protein